MRKTGFTLIEVIVVIAIIGVISAIAVPSLYKTGILTRDKVSAGAGQLISILKAARTYAGTYNIDTAVAFNVDVQAGYEVLTGAAVMRRMTRQELEDLTRMLFPHLPSTATPEERAEYIQQLEAFQQGMFGSECSSRLPFIPVGGADHAWRKFPSNIVVAHLQNQNSVDLDQSLEDWKIRSGLCPIRALDSDISLLVPRVPFWVDEFPGDANNFNADYAKNRWPSIIFQPTGICYSPGGDAARFQLTVCMSPTLEGTERAGNYAHVEIYSLMGRIQSMQ